MVGKGPGGGDTKSGLSQLEPTWSFGVALTPLFHPLLSLYNNCAMCGSADGGRGGGRGGRGEGRGRGRGRGAGRGGRGRGSSEVRGDFENAPARGGGRGGGRGHERERRPRRYEDGDRRGRHDGMDRRDASGRGSDKMKKEGSGKGNWGTSTDAADDVAAEEDAKKDAKKDAENGEGEDESEDPAEPAVNEVSYEEYLKEQEAKKAALNAKKAISSVEESFDGCVVSGKAQGDANDFFVGVGIKAKASRAKTQRSAQNKATVEVGFRPPPIERPGRDYGDRDSFGGRGRGRGRGEGGRGRGEGGRGRGEGGRGRGRGRGSRNDSAPVDLSAEAFPSLGGK